MFELVCDDAMIVKNPELIMMMIFNHMQLLTIIITYHHYYSLSILL
jgi:hypothetical protein